MKRTKINWAMHFGHNSIRDQMSDIIHSKAKVKCINIIDHQVFYSVICKISIPLLTIDYNTKSSS